MSKNKQDADGHDVPYVQSPPSYTKGFAEDHEPLVTRDQVAEADWARLIDSLGRTIRTSVDEHLAAGRTVYGLDAEGHIAETRR